MGSALAGSIRFANADPNSYRYIYTYRHTYGDIYTYLYIYTYRDTYGDIYTYGHTCTYRNACAWSGGGVWIQ